MPKVIDMDEKRTTQQRPPRGESAPKTAPKATAPKVDPPKKTRTAADKKLGVSVAGFYQTAGLGLLAMGMNREDAGLAGTGTALIENAETVAEAWLDLADQNPAVKRALVKFTQVSAAGTLVTMHGMMLLPLLADRGVIPPMVAATMAGQAQQNGNGAAA